MSQSDLRTAKAVDLATLALNFDAFRDLAANPHLNDYERIGFPPGYREGYETAIFADIVAKLPMLASATPQSILDIGPGCAGLPRMLIDLVVQKGHRLILLDSREMLERLPDAGEAIQKRPGSFPQDAAKIRSASPRGLDAILCYSVMHYMYADTNLFDVVDAAIDLMAPGGRALFGDIPNVSKRRRFFASEAGRKFHRDFTGRDEDPVQEFNLPTPGKIDDAILAALVHRAQLAGCDAYILPQPATLPMANRRDDLLISKP